MKFYLKILMTAFAAMALCVGCSKQSKVDTTQLETSFKSADATSQSTVDKAVSAIKSSDYAGAMTELKNLAANAKLTPEQQQAVKDVVAQLQTLIAESANKAAGDASKAANDLGKSLPK